METTSRRNKQDHPLPSNPFPHPLSTPSHTHATGTLGAAAADPCRSLGLPPHLPPCVLPTLCCAPPPSPPYHMYQCSDIACLLPRATSAGSSIRTVLAGRRHRHPSRFLLETAGDVLRPLMPIFVRRAKLRPRAMRIRHPFLSLRLSPIFATHFHLVPFPPCAAHLPASWFRPAESAIRFVSIY
ncbi:hypothetical protein GY45DRAFT_119688 [Cubamyces sp. BRFM 1775]|nr:hypothetical protein GY45DRAFT_119688 [Cubamyces sp. BRFM 1775]